MLSRAHLHYYCMLPESNPLVFMNDSKKISILPSEPSYNELLRANFSPSSLFEHADGKGVGHKLVLVFLETYI